MALDSSNLPAAWQWAGWDGERGCGLPAISSDRGAPGAEGKLRREGKGLLAGKGRGERWSGNQVPPTGTDRVLGLPEQSRAMVHCSHQIPASLSRYSQFIHREAISPLVTSPTWASSFISQPALLEGGRRGTDIKKRKKKDCQLCQIELGSLPKRPVDFRSGRNGQAFSLERKILGGGNISFSP